jgi:hypothetical protein
MDWEIVLVDEVLDEEATKWEQYYYDELMPLYNHQRPGQTQNEYHRAIGYAAKKAYYRSEKYKESERAYYQANKAAIAEQSRAYYQANKERILQRYRNRRANR